MLRWAGDCYCVIDMNGKEVAHNLNRLIRHHAWDDANMRTDVPKNPPSVAGAAPNTGTIIAFPTTYNEEHRCVFGLGKVIEVRGPNNIHFQWLGNKPVSEAQTLRIGLGRPKRQQRVLRKGPTPRITPTVDKQRHSNRPCSVCNNRTRQNTVPKRQNKHHIKRKNRSSNRRRNNMGCSVAPKKA